MSVPASRAACSTAAATSSAVAETAGTKARRRRRRVRRGAGVGAPRRRSRGRAAEHVDRVGDARLGGKHVPEGGDGGILERPQLEAGSLARVGAEDPEPTRVRHDPDETAGRLRPARGGAATSTSSSSVAARITPPGGRGRRRRRPSPPAQRCASPRALPSSWRCRSFRRSTGLRRATCRAIRSEPPRVAEGLHVEEDCSRLLVVGPHRAGRSWRRPPCCRSRRTPRGRVLSSPRPRAAQGRGRRSARRSRCSPAAPSATRTSR